MKTKHSVILLCMIVLISCKRDSTKAEVPEKIEVTGSAEMEFVPDEIYMTFTLKEYLDAEKKKIKLETIKTDFLNLCKAKGIADSNISISGYTGIERWDYFYKKRKNQPDFMGTISYVVKVSSPDKLDDLVANLNEKGVENFYISKTTHSHMEQFRKEVKIKALLAAKNKADYLAKSIGEEIGEALLIQEIDDSDNGRFFKSNYNALSNTLMESRGNNTPSPDFEKIKLRYEMKTEFKLK